MMICEKCERIGRLNKIPHHVEIGEDGIAEVDCEKEEIETYVKALGFDEIAKFWDENPEYIVDPDNLDHDNKTERLFEFCKAVIKKVGAMLNAL